MNGWGRKRARACKRFAGTPAPRAGRTGARRAAWPGSSPWCEALPPHLKVLGAPGWPSRFSPCRFERKPARACREDSQFVRRVCSAGLPALGHAIERRPTQRRELRAKRTRARPPGGVTQRHAQPLHCSTKHVDSRAHSESIDNNIVETEGRETHVTTRARPIPTRDSTHPPGRKSTCASVCGPKHANTSDTIRGPTKHAPATGGTLESDERSVTCGK